MTSEHHPEELIDRARRGALDSAEQSTLSHHLAACAACAGLLAQEAWLDRELAPQPRDEILDERAVEAATMRLQRSSFVGRSQVWPRWLRLAVACALLAFAVTATATTIVGRKLWLRAPAPARAPRPVEPPQAHSSPPPIAPAPEDVPDPAEPTRPSAAIPRPTPVRPVVTADALFERAGKLRREGQADTAIAVYRRLQQSFPEARETQLSFALAGQLLLDRGRPGDALAQFDRHPRIGGDVGEETLAGRAVALEQLHRTSDAIATWKSLLERYPRSIYAARARARLTQLTEPR